MHLHVAEMRGRERCAREWIHKRKVKEVIVSGAPRMSADKESIASGHEEYQILSREDDTENCTWAKLYEYMD